MPFVDGLFRRLVNSTGEAAEFGSAAKRRRDKGPIVPIAVRVFAGHAFQAFTEFVLSSLIFLTVAALLVAVHGKADPNDSVHPSFSCSASGQALSQRISGLTVPAISGSFIPDEVWPQHRVQCR
jgi:hypothetical protein